MSSVRSDIIIIIINTGVRIHCTAKSIVTLTSGVIRNLSGMGKVAIAHSCQAMQPNSELMWYLESFRHSWKQQSQPGLGLLSK